MRRVLTIFVLIISLCPGISQAAGARENVLSSDPQATEAAQAVLHQGGSAADAAVTAAFVLAVVSPQSAGPGGLAGGLSLHAHTGEVTAWDGSAVAPAAAGPDLFIGRDGKPMGLRDVVPGGRTVGVPGALRLLEALHRAEGRLPWDRLLAPAIALAEDGYIVSPDLARALAAAAKGGEPPGFLKLFRTADGKLPHEGERRSNHALAQTLRMIAASGADAVLRGPLAAEIASTVRNDATPGLLTADDMAAYTLPTRPPFCAQYRIMKLCSLGPPDQAGTMLIRAMAVLDHIALPRLDPAGVESAQALLQVWRHSAAEAAPLLADPDAMAVKPDDLLAPARITGLARELALRAKPNGKALPAAATAPLALETSTASVLVVDREGNAVNLEQSLHSPFGAQIAVAGFLLNDGLAGFAAGHQDGASKPLNHVDASKRPLAELAPLFSFDAAHKLRLMGTAAGPHLGEDAAAWLAQTLVRLVDFHLSPRIALAAPFWHLEAGGVVLDDVSGARPLANALRSKGEHVTLRPARAELLVLSMGDETTLSARSPATPRAP